MSAEDVALVLDEAKEAMEKSIRSFRIDLQRVRTGRANPGLVDSLRVEVYGSSCPIKQVAVVGAPEPNQIVIRPHDPNTLKDIEKAILASELGLNPQSDGRLIRLIVPPLSGEVRRAMVTRIRKLCEEAKVAIRNIRRDGNKMAEQAEKAKTLSEDLRDDVKEEIQDLTKKYESEADDLAKVREKDVLDD